jgi:hypothetical protein
MMDQAVIWSALRRFMAMQSSQSTAAMTAEATVAAPTRLKRQRRFIMARIVEDLAT